MLRLWSLKKIWTCINELRLSKRDKGIRILRIKNLFRERHFQIYSAFFRIVLSGYGDCKGLNLLKEADDFYEIFKTFRSFDKIVATFLKIFVIRRIYLLITGTEHKNSKKQANSRAYPSAINTCAEGPLKMRLIF